jgi:hypothetical protein
MRPNAEQHDSRAEDGRIIYLGDVRRRRLKRRHSPDRHYVAVLAVLAGASWLIWATVVLSLAPARLLTYLAFFGPLGVALAATGALLAYAIESKLGWYPSLLVCGRRGVLFAALVVINLALLAGRAWSPLICLCAVGAAGVVELALDRRAA